jgi:adenosylmethionine-8-amino-7-oxononanoate aminotransferase
VPLGGVGITNEAFEPIEIFQHLHTYSNHPVSCAAGLKNLEIMHKEKLVENSAKMGKHLLDGLKSLESHPTVGEARGTGLWAAMDFTMDKKKRTPFAAERLSSMVNRAFSKGLVVKVMGQALEFAPPLIIQKSDIDEGLKILDECITEEEKATGVKS